MYTCKQCKTATHFKCDIILASSLQDVQEDLNYVKEFIAQLECLAYQNSLPLYNSELSTTLEDFKQQVENLDENLQEALKRNLQLNFVALEAELAQIQLSLSENEEIREILFLSASREASLQRSQNLKKAENSKKMPQHQVQTDQVKRNFRARNQNEAENAFHRNLLNFDNSRLRDFRTNSRNFTRNLWTKFKQKQSSLIIREGFMKLKVNFWLILLSIILILMFPMLTNKFSEYTSQGEFSIEDLSMKVDQLKIYTDRKDLEQITELNRVKKIVAKQIDKDPDERELALDTANSTSNEFMQSMIDLNYRMGPKEVFEMYNVIGGQQFLIRNFLSSYYPPSIEFFSFNREINLPRAAYNSHGRVYYNQYGIQDVIRTTKSQVYLNKLSLSYDDLSQIMRASANSKKLIIKDCDINVSPDLDFSTDYPPKTEYLSFENTKLILKNKSRNCQNNNCQLTLEDVIIAIKTSHFIDSLKTINIYQAGIYTEYAEDLLNNHGLYNIEIIQEQTSFAEK
ncbi:unnamed protein product [Moneuplotes crassus]|uniref:Uncharacterized protein n=1 Tax=Euplotes crassus TaxID=5936 RepID=A0AAD2D9Y4_EUPCR|nr:unnamed protein product [Moneuplotes crassus]